MAGVNNGSGDGSGYGFLELPYEEGIPNTINFGE
jgi:hypothetical protein